MRERTGCNEWQETVSGKRRASKSNTRYLWIAPLQNWYLMHGRPLNQFWPSGLPLVGGHGLSKGVRNSRGVAIFDRMKRM